MLPIELISFLIPTEIIKLVLLCKETYRVFESNRFLTQGTARHYSYVANLIFGIPLSHSANFKFLMHWGIFAGKHL